MSNFPPEKIFPRAKYERWLVEGETYYNYPDLVWVRCSGSDEQAKKARGAYPESTSSRGTVFRAREATIKCSRCEFEVPESQALPWIRGVRYERDDYLKVQPPEHERLLTIYEQVDRTLIEIGELLGFSKRDDVLLHATYNATKREGRDETYEGMVATGMDELTRALVRRSTVKDASRAASKLISFKLESNWAAREASEKTYDNEEGPEDGIPFFSEAVLYPLLGKDEARTVLAYVNQIARATSASADDDEA